MFNKSYKLIKVSVEDIDKGSIMTSLVLRSGRRILTVVMPTSEVVMADIETGREAFCIMFKKDIVIFRDVKYFFDKFLSNKRLDSICSSL